MRVLVLVKPNLKSETNPTPNPKGIAAMGNFNEELIKAGVLVAMDGLKSSAAGARVKFAGGKRQVVDGPFSEAKELVGGFWIWQVKDLAEAIEWARRCPDASDGADWELELRPIAGPEDLAIHDPTGELYQRAEAQRAQARGPAKP